MNEPNLERERTNLRVFLVAAVGIILGILFLWLSREVEPTSISANLLRDMGSLLIVSLCLTLVWELGAKRSFTSEILAHTQLAHQIEQAGLVGLPTKWNEDIPWSRLLREAEHIDIFVAYGTNWRGAYADELMRFAKRVNTSCRVILPDPDNEAVVRAVACQFRRDPGLVKERILDATQEFTSRFSAVNRPDRCEIWYHARPPLFSFFICGDTAVITLYKHNPNKPDVMGLLIRRGGTYFDFLEGEVESMLEENGRRANPGGGRTVEDAAVDLNRT